MDASASFTTRARSVSPDFSALSVAIILLRNSPGAGRIGVKMAHQRFERALCSLTLTASSTATEMGRNSLLLHSAQLPIDIGAEIFVVRKNSTTSCSTGQEAVLVVKSVQDGVCHNSARSVDTMPLALELHGEIQGRIGKAGPQRRVRSASIVMREPRPQSFLKMFLGQGDNPIQTLTPECPE